MTTFLYHFCIYIVFNVNVSWLQEWSDLSDPLTELLVSYHSTAGFVRHAPFALNIKYSACAIINMWVDWKMS